LLLAVYPASDRGRKLRRRNMNDPHSRIGDVCLLGLRQPW